MVVLRVALGNAKRFCREWGLFEFPFSRQLDGRSDSNSYLLLRRRNPFSSWSFPLGLEVSLEEPLDRLAMMPRNEDVVVAQG